MGDAPGLPESGVIQAPQQPKGRYATQIVPALFQNIQPNLTVLQALVTASRAQGLIQLAVVRFPTQNIPLKFYPAKYIFLTFSAKRKSTLHEGITRQRGVLSRGQSRWIG